VDEEEASIEKGRRADFATHPVSASEVSRENAVEYVEKADAESIARIRVEVARLVVLVARDRWGRNANEQERDSRWRVWDFFNAKSLLDARRPTIEALAAGGNPLLARGPELKPVGRLRRKGIHHR
jgi:hypothetical protein